MQARIDRRRFVIAAAATLAASAPARAAFEPDRPIELLVSFGAGGTADGLARLIAQRLQERRRWTVIVVNRPGGGGVVMQRALKRARPDGYTIGLGSSHELTYPPAEASEAPFGLKDFACLASVADLPHCLVGRPADRLDSAEAWKAYAARKGSISIGFTPPYEPMLVRLGSDLGITIVPVPFKGGAETMTQVAAGNIDLGWSAGSHAALEQAGKVKVCMALTPNRLPSYPAVLTAREFGSGISVESRFVVMGASELPASLAADIEGALREVLSEPTTQAFVRDRGLIPDLKTGATLARALNVEAENARGAVR